MKILCAVSILFGAAILVLGASAGAASAGGIYGWGSAGCCGGSGGYGCAGCGGYGGCGPGGCAMGGSTFWYVGDYDRYIIGHGAMYPAGDSPRPAYWYVPPVAPDAIIVPKRP